jgi:hypothetical protein
MSETPDTFRSRMDAAVNELADLERTDRRRRRASLLLTASAAILSVVAGVLLAASPLNKSRKGPYVAPLDSRPVAMMADMETVKAQLRRVEERVQVLSSSPREAFTPDVVTQRIVELQTVLESTNKRLARIEEVILADPSKALELTLLKRDIQSIQAVQAANMDAVKDGAERVYDMMKWILGSTVLAVLALSLGSVFKGFFKSPEPKADS